MGAQASRSRPRHALAVQDTGPDSLSVDKIKVVVLGEAAAGKTTLFRRWMGAPLDAEYAPSASASVGAKLLRLEGHEPVVYELWDVPPQSFAGPSIFARYFRGAQAVVLIFSLQTPASWRMLPTYLDVARREIAATESIETQAPKSLPVVMVGNKSDCIGQGAQHEREAARSWCHEHGVAYVEVSALAGESAAVLDVLKLL
ncbi:hypothetical protein PHYPSEUDO_007341 [Phytophthora pseudosyringae]|uniref:Uncharacterized protein n=1 Tax=Phytophthora pseudosyringae TaxID=221518 RepID=A0A8T1WM23_9STRA|nr:hypothetical protein PHYPSEUDO_007341 [Phytophthora pseudosyringae]